MISYVVPFFGTTYKMAPPENVDFANAKVSLARIRIRGFH